MSIFSSLFGKGTPSDGTNTGSPVDTTASKSEQFKQSLKVNVNAESNPAQAKQVKPSTSSEEEGKGQREREQVMEKGTEAKKADVKKSAIPKSDHRPSHSAFQQAIAVKGTTYPSAKGNTIGNANGNTTANAPGVNGPSTANTSSNTGPNSGPNGHGHNGHGGGDGR